MSGLPQPLLSDQMPFYGHAVGDDGFVSETLLAYELGYRTLAPYLATALFGEGCPDLG
jgi:hypothetical protein